MGLLYLTKTVGETPLESIKRQVSGDVAKYSYAGRLDPMAEGMLLVLTDDDCKQQPDYLLKDKEYEFELLFGYSTDTSDWMGMPEELPSEVKLESSKIAAELQKISPKFTGTITQQLPWFCSYRVDGKPLFWWARNDKSAVQPPSREVKIYSLELLKVDEVNFAELASNAAEVIERVNGDFRQAEIVKNLQVLAAKNRHLRLPRATFKARVASGVYIRQLCLDIAAALGLHGMACKIVRTAIG